MVVNRVLLCRNCGARIFWLVRYKFWTHRHGQVACNPYVRTVAEPTVFAAMTGEQF